MSTDARALAFFESIRGCLCSAVERVEDSPGPLAAAECPGLHVWRHVAVEGFTPEEAQQQAAAS